MHLRIKPGEDGFKNNWPSVGPLRYCGEKEIYESNLVAAKACRGVQRGPPVRILCRDIRPVLEQESHLVEGSGFADANST